jgi:hypothetical protein
VLLVDRVGQIHAAAALREIELVLSQHHAEVGSQVPLQTGRQQRDGACPACG